MFHSKQDDIQRLIEHNIPVLLEGEKGSGKSTILMNVAKELGYNYVSITGTRQTTVGNLLGFISVTGTYIPSLLRKAVEEGHLFVIEEVDGMDPNTLLCLNTLENGYLAFPDQLVDVHPNFRLCATANPTDEHASYTGRSKLDAATLDRFDTIRVDRDENLEVFITDRETVDQVNAMRKILSYNNMDFTVSMRDTIRYYKRKQIGMADSYDAVLLKHDHLVHEYRQNRAKQPTEPTTQADCNSVDELWEFINTKGDKQ